jgi:hypothetical protein
MFGTVGDRAYPVSTEYGHASILNSEFIILN